MSRSATQAPGGFEREARSRQEHHPLRFEERRPAWQGATARSRRWQAGGAGQDRAHDPIRLARRDARYRHGQLERPWWRRNCELLFKLTAISKKVVIELGRSGLWRSDADEPKKGAEEGRGRAGIEREHEVAVVHEIRRGACAMLAACLRAPCGTRRPEAVSRRCRAGRRTCCEFHRVQPGYDYIGEFMNDDRNGDQSRRADARRSRSARPTGRCGANVAGGQSSPVGTEFQRDWIGDFNVIAPDRSTPATGAERRHRPGIDGADVSKDALERQVVGGFVQVLFVAAPVDGRPGEVAAVRGRTTCARR